MKKYFNIMICSFIMIFCIIALIKINTYSVTEIKTENNLFATINKVNDNIEKKEKERLEKERLEKEKKEKERKEIERREQLEREKQVQIVKTTSNKSTTSNSNNIKMGTYGRLYVSNFSVALYDYNVNMESNNSLQTIVNNADSAAYYTTNNRLVIADHNYQGFNVLVNLNIGDTSYIKLKNGSTIRYKLIKKSKGYNKGEDLVDTNGNSFFKMNSDIIMYTCYQDGIMATLWTLL